MKKQLFILFLMTLLFYQCKETEPTSFDEKALMQKVESLDGGTLPLSEVFANYKGKVVFIDIWASWCGDCIKSLPLVKKLKEEYKDNVVFLYLSMDKEKEKWIEAINKYQLEGEHFYVGSDWKTDFPSSINLNWIPRFMILGKEGKIEMYRAEEINEPKIKKTLKTTLQLD